MSLKDYDAKSELCLCRMPATCVKQKENLTNISVGRGYSTICTSAIKNRERPEIISRWGSWGRVWDFSPSVWDLSGRSGLWGFSWCLPLEIKLSPLGKHFLRNRGLSLIQLGLPPSPNVKEDLWYPGLDFFSNIQTWNVRMKENFLVPYPLCQRSRGSLIWLSYNLQYFWVFPSLQFEALDSSFSHSIFCKKLVLIVVLNLIVIIYTCWYYVFMRC